MVPKKHESRQTALNSATANGTTAVMIITRFPGTRQVTNIEYFTFRNITHSGDLKEDFPLVLEDNQEVSDLL
jgi:hypothetical protein